MSKGGYHHRVVDKGGHSRELGQSDIVKVSVQQYCNVRGTELTELLLAAHLPNTAKPVNNNGGGVHTIP